MTDSNKKQVQKQKNMLLRKFSLERYMTLCYILSMKIYDVAEYIEKTRTTEAALAKMVGVSQSYISLLKNFKRRPSPEIARKLESITGVSLRNILFPVERGKQMRQPGKR